MEFLLSALTVIGVAIMLGAAIAFGFALLMWFMLVAMAISLVILMRQWWLRWRFLRAEKKASTIIEVNYRDISSDE